MTKPTFENRKHKEGEFPTHARRGERVRRSVTANIAVLFSLVAFADARAQRHMYDGWEGGPYMMPWNMGWFGSLLMFALWVAFIVAVFVLLKRWIQSSRNENQPPAPRPSAMDILRERYARGEIDKEEFEERKRVLEENR